MPAAHNSMDHWFEAWIASNDGSTLTEYMASHFVPPPPAPPAYMDPGTKPTPFEEQVNRVYELTMTACRRVLIPGRDY